MGYNELLKMYERSCFRYRKLEDRYTDLERDFKLLLEFCKEREKEYESR